MDPQDVILQESIALPHEEKKKGQRELTEYNPMLKGNGAKARRSGRHAHNWTKERHEQDVDLVVIWFGLEREKVSSKAHCKCPSASAAKGERSSPRQKVPIPRFKRSITPDSVTWRCRILPPSNV